MDAFVRPPKPPNLELQPREPDCEVPLTPEQVRLWSAYSQNGRALSRRVCIAALRIVGPLDVDLLATSVKAVVERHEALRTRIACIGNRLTQQVGTVNTEVMRFVDLSGSNAGRDEFEIKRRCGEFLAEEVDLAEGPLFAAGLWQLSRTEHVFVAAVDHIVSDNTSNAIVGREIWSLYERSLNGQLEALPPLPLQFADYAVWQHRRYSLWKEAHDAYWRGWLGNTACIRAPIHGDSSGYSPVVHRMRAFSFGIALTNALRDACRRENVRLPVVAVALYAAMLALWSGQMVFVLPVVLHGRHGTEDLKKIVGFIANEAYIRIVIDERKSLHALVRTVAAEFTVACACQDLGRIPDLLPACSPELAFNWQTTTATRSCPRLGGDQLLVTPWIMKGALLPETLAPFFYDIGSDVTLIIHYRENILTSDVLEMLGNSLKSMARQFVVNPDEPLGALWRRDTPHST